MADEFQLGRGNWWDGTRNRYDSGSTAPTSNALNSMGSFGWQTAIVDVKARSSTDPVSVSGSSMGDFTDSQRLQQGHESSSGASLLSDPSLQMMGLGLSSQSMDWNQALFRGEKAESSFRSMLQEDQGNANFQQEAAASQEQWRQKLFGGSSEDSSLTDFKQFNRGLSLDQPQYSSHTSSNNSSITSQGLSTNFQVDSAPYGSPNVLQGILVSDNPQQQQSTFDSRSINYSYPSSYAINPADQLMPSNSWSKFPQFLRTSPPKQQPPHVQLHFSNNTQFWNASTAAINDARSSFFPSLQTPLPTSSYEEKPKQTATEVRELAKKTSSEASNKRQRNEATPSPMPAFKVRKEKMGDRITALQQLVSPFGKTDTASVLSDTIDYIKFLHQQLDQVLSTPYMKSGAHNIQHQQNPDKSKDPEGPKQDLGSRGLCLVPVPSTFPVINESNFDFWNPTFGGTYR